MPDKKRFKKVDKKTILIPAPNMWSETDDVIITPEGIHTIGYEYNYTSILRSNNNTVGTTKDRIEC